MHLQTRKLKFNQDFLKLERFIQNKKDFNVQLGVQFSKIFTTPK